ncbi:MAG: beta-galactosidase [Bacteroidales bacterium]
MTFSTEGRNFIRDGKKVFLNSGEIHYFRIKRELWNRHLDEAVKAGLSTVSTYIPWAWHEAEEGVFDFNGSTCPEKDLEGWLKRCHEHGLTCIVRPGPFILAEFRGAGLPDWFLEKHGEEVRMRDRMGLRVMSDGVSLFNAHYLEKVGLWYDRIMPLVSRNEEKSGGPVIMMQICNEIGVFSWLARQADYGNKVKERFISYLEERFANIEEVNELWGTDYRSFEMIELPPDGITPYASAADRGRDNEWHRFWRKYYGDYLRMLTSMARERGVTVPLYHNLPGWIYGSGYEFPVNITMYEDLYNDKSEIIFGVDHIPEFLSYRNMHDDRIVNDITAAMQGNGPLFAAEFQSGSREYHVVTNPREMELFYKASIANGLKGWNYYMFSQGRNPDRRGYSGETFYWFTPMTAGGDRTSAFGPIERISRILKVSGPVILEAERRAEVCVLFYPPHYATELERQGGASAGLTFVPSSIRRPAYFDGLLRVLQILNVDYDMADLSTTSAGSLSRYKQVWAFTTDEMDAPAQQTIVDYVTGGGNAVLYPYLPDRGLSQKPCTLIRDAFSVSPSGTEVIDSSLIDILGFRDVKCSNPQITFSEESLTGSEVIARTLSGTPCGISRSVGSGSVIYLGTWIGFDTEGHKPVYEAILGRSGAKLRHALSGNEYLTVRERFTGDGRGLLFVANYYNEERLGRVIYTHPETGEYISLPLAGEAINWPPLYGVLTPLCIEISEGLKILHSTSDILGYRVNRGEVEVTLYGDRDLAGETVLEGLHTEGILSAEIEGAKVEFSRTNGRIILSYSHRHKSEVILKIKTGL